MFSNTASIPSTSQQYADKLITYGYHMYIFKHSKSIGLVQGVVHIMLIIILYGAQNISEKCLLEKLQMI